ncbi:MAG: 30S ribosomal protein S20 [Candidatus Aminicenantes bacterium]|nr:30S ribosomal protein S20 [Candidatus Aminicenantes bacterium]
MANHKSAIRQWRRSLQRNEINRRNKSALRTQIKTIRTAIQNKDWETAHNLLPKTFSIIDITVKKRTIHKNMGDRLKSRLSRQIEPINTTPSK